MVLTQKERRRYLDADQFADIWNNTGSYEDRRIEPDPETGFVRVYRKSAYPTFWEVLTISPTSAPLPNDVFSFWVGNCVKANSPLTSTGTIANCQSYVLIGDVAVNFRTSAQNLTSVPRIRDYLAGLVSQW